MIYRPALTYTQLAYLITIAQSQIAMVDVVLSKPSTPPEFRPVLIRQKADLEVAIEAMRLSLTP